MSYQYQQQGYEQEIEQQFEEQPAQQQGVASSFPFGPIDIQDLYTEFDLKTSELTLASSSMFFNIYPSDYELNIEMKRQKPIDQALFYNTDKEKGVYIILSEHKTKSINKEIFEKTFRITLKTILVEGKHTIDLSMFKDNVAEEDLNIFFDLFTTGRTNFQVFMFPVFLGLLLVFDMHFFFKEIVNAMQQVPLNTLTSTTSYDDLLFYLLQSEKTENEGEVCNDSYIKMYHTFSYLLLNNNFQWFKDSQDQFSPLFRFMTINQLKMFLDDSYFEINLNAYNAAISKYSEENADRIPADLIAQIPIFYYKVIGEVIQGSTKDKNDEELKQLINDIFKDYFPIEEMPFELFSVIIEIFPNQVVESMLEKQTYLNKQKIGLLELNIEASQILLRQMRWQRLCFV